MLFPPGTISSGCPPAWMIDSTPQNGSAACRQDVTMKTRSFLPLWLTAAVLCPALSLPAAEPSSRPISYARDIRPILSDRCFRCHGPDETQRKAELRLDVRAEALKGGQSGEKAITPREPSKSEVVLRIFSTNPREQMPPPSSKLKLADAEKHLLKRWIEEGATYEQHWAFVKPQRPSLPVTKNRA